MRIRGKVQGVFFRANCRKKALALGLTGYAKNLPDGSVEVFVNGPRTDEFRAWLSTNPGQSQVESVEIQNSATPTQANSPKVQPSTGQPQQDSLEIPTNSFDHTQAGENQPQTSSPPTQKDFKIL